MTLDIPKSRIVIRISLLLVYLTLSSQVFDSKPLYAITTPYSPEIYILNASSTAASVLNKSSSSIVSINAVKVWQENGEFNRILKLGSKGNDVKVLQIILKSLTVDKTKNSTTGYFGPNTQKNLKIVQTKLSLPVTGELDSSTKMAINDLMFKELCPTSVRIIEENDLIKSDFDKVFENLNRSTAVPLDYIPQDLVRVSKDIKTIGVMCVSNRITRHLNEMISDAKEENLDIAITSSYRSADMQKFLYSMWINKSGPSAKSGIAEAGHSEHQLGTTIDVTGKSIHYAGVSPKFAYSKEGKWMAKNSYKYGFIMSYPDKKQKETGYIYEPWHFRYIGVDNANDIFTEKMTIQEFLSFATTTTMPATSTASSATSTTPSI